MADEASAGAGAGAGALPKLTYEEISDLNARKATIKAAHEGYLAEHPEVKTIISDFFAAMLAEKPDDVLGFARRHFAQFGGAADAAAEAAAKEADAEGGADAE